MINKITTVYASEIETNARLEPRFYYNQSLLKNSFDKFGYEEINSFATLKSGSTPEHSENKLESLKLGKSPSLHSLRCSDNNLTNPHFLSTLANPEKLTHLTIRNNNFSEQDLSFLAPFKGLQSLRLGNGSENRIQQNIYNRFYGSLEPLKDMANLEELWIDNTDINRGLNYLPKSLEKIRCSAVIRPESKVKEIAEAEQIISFLTDESEGEGKYNLKNWREREQNAQQWLDKEYPREIRKGIKELNIDKNLEGNLFLEGFSCLERLHISSQKKGSSKLTGLDLTGAPKLKELECSGNSLQSLNLNSNKELTTLVCSANKLTSLDLSNCRNLERLECHNNQLEELNLADCSKLKILDCNRNQLKDLDISDLTSLEILICADNKLESPDFLTQLPNSRILNYLSIRNNNFPPQDLSFLRKVELVNLEYLSVSDNQFHGSLEFLGGLTELKDLKISNTDIEGGLEHLPEKLEKIYCETNQHSENRCQNIAKQLEDYWEIDGNQMIFCNYHEWREDNKKRNKIDYELKTDRKSGRNLQKKKVNLEDKIKKKIEERKEKLNNWYKRKQRKAPHRQNSTTTIFEQPATQFLPIQTEEQVIELNEEPIQQKRIKDLEQQLNAEQQELERISQENRLIKELAEIVMPKGIEWDIQSLRKEVEELKIRDLNSQKSQLIKKIADIKKAAGESLEKVVELFLESQKMISREKRENDQFAKNQLESFKSCLLQGLTPEKIQELSQLQNQISKIEKQLTDLQRQRIKFEAQIEIK